MLVSTKIVRSNIVALGSLIAALYFAPSLPAQTLPTPLKDVCPDGWARYICSNFHAAPLLCVSPAATEAFLDKSGKNDGLHHSCGLVLAKLVPGTWIDSSSYNVDCLNQAGLAYSGYIYSSEIVNVTSRDPKYLTSAALHLEPKPLYAFPGARAYLELDRAEYAGPLYRKIKSLDTYGLPLPKPPNSGEVCPVSWSTYSCEFVRLCVSPTVLHNYALIQSDPFRVAYCKADQHNVPKEWVGSTPHDVGFAQGALLLGRRYLNAVLLDSKDIVNDDLDEALTRLLLAPISAKTHVAYLRGMREGMDEFDSFLAKNKAKAEKSGMAPKGGNR